MSDSRPAWDEYYLIIARAFSVRADCTRRKVGAIVVKDHKVEGHGYNGAPPGDAGCLTENACPRGRMSTADVLPGSSYDTGPGACIALHAEQNAVIRAGRNCMGATLYLTDGPCQGCQRLIKGSGIYRVVWPNGEWYPNAG